MKTVEVTPKQWTSVVGDNGLSRYLLETMVIDAWIELTIFHADERI